MARLRIALAVALLAVTSVSLAQGAGAGERGSIPPGNSQDGSSPSEGAITGGSVLQGETGAAPDTGLNRRPEGEINRCKELSGVLRDQCLRDAGGASTGATSGPQSTPGPAVRDPVTAPPPQNPR